MKMAYSELGIVVDTSDGIFELVIENQKTLFKILNSIYNQIEGDDGTIVFSDNGVTLQASKTVELITSFIPFEINRKPLVNKLITRFVKTSVDEIYYEKTLEINRALEEYFLDIGSNLTGSILFNKCNIESVVKGVGIHFDEDYDSLAEKIIDYFELVREYDKDKLFLLYNVRSLMADDELKLFIDTVELYKYNVVLIESKENSLTDKLNRCIIDKDNCIIS